MRYRDLKTEDADDQLKLDENESNPESCVEQEICVLVSDSDEEVNSQDVAQYEDADNYEDEEEVEKNDFSIVDASIIPNAGKKTQFFKIL